MRVKENIGQDSIRFFGYTSTIIKVADGKFADNDFFWDNCGCGYKTIDDVNEHFSSKDSFQTIFELVTEESNVSESANKITENPKNPIRETLINTSNPSIALGDKLQVLCDDFDGDDFNFKDKIGTVVFIKPYGVVLKFSEKKYGKVGRYDDESRNDNCWFFFTKDVKPFVKPQKENPNVLIDSIITSDNSSIDIYRNQNTVIALKTLKGKTVSKGVAKLHPDYSEEFDEATGIAIATLRCLGLEVPNSLID